MSGTVRLLAIGSGAVLAALFYFVRDSRWYWAVLAGVLALVAVPMLHEWITGVFRRKYLKQVVKRARDPDHDNKP